MTDDPGDLLAAVLARPQDIPVERDWSFPTWRDDGGFNRYGWNAGDQALFDACWDDAATALADSLIGTHGAMWPWAMERAAAARHPDLLARVRGLAEGRRIAQRNSYRDQPEMLVGTAMMYGSFDHMRAIRSWPDAPTLVCPICGGSFHAGVLSHWMLRQHGPPRFCNTCCMRARAGRPHDDRVSIVAGIRALAHAIEGIPAQDLAASVSLGGMDDARRDRVMRGLIVAPDTATAKRALGRTWLEVLQAVGLVGDAWRPAMGTYCLAVDGHPCRSLAERTVDDWLAAHGIAHACEPAYPGSAKRADWRLADGTYVEFAGLLGDAAYRAAIEEKRAMAAAAGIPLLVIMPEDLADLGRVFGPGPGRREETTEGR